MEAVGKEILPQVMVELDFYHVQSLKELNYRLLTLQRVAAAAVGAYLFYRYHPHLTSQISHIPYASQLVSTVSFLVGYTLCSAAAFLVLGGSFIYEGCVQVLSGIKHKKIGDVALGSFGVLSGYLTCQMYRKYQFCIYPSSNHLDTLFTKVSISYCVPLWNRFYR